MAYRLEYAPAARKAIRAIRDTKLKRRIEAALLGLREDPRPPGAKRLAGQEGLLRIRVGDWRILYEVHEREVVVLVVRIGRAGRSMSGWGDGGCEHPRYSLDFVWSGPTGYNL